MVPGPDFFCWGNINILEIRLCFQKIYEGTKKQAQICAEGCEEDNITHIFQI